MFLLKVYLLSNKLFFDDVKHTASYFHNENHQREKKSLNKNNSRSNRGWEVKKNVSLSFYSLLDDCEKFFYPQKVGLRNFPCSAMCVLYDLYEII